MKKLSGMISVAVVCAIMLFSAAAYANNNGDENHVAAEQAFKAKIVKNIGHGKKVYFAGPMFNAAEKGFNLKVTQVLEEYGYQVFLPQRDGIEAAKLEGKTEEELVKMIFRVELGIAYASGKRCYGFKTDVRAVEFGLEMNPMISGCMIKIFKNFDGDKLIEEIKEYLSKNAL